MSWLHPACGIRPACKRLRLRVVATLLIASQSALLAAPPVSQREPYFIAPVTGQRVTHYDVSLSLVGNSRQAFHVPRDCGTLTGLIERREADRSRVIDRRLWLKVENDCRYHSLLHRHASKGIADYVTGYDFDNLALDILPYEPGCPKDAPAQCAPVLTDATGRRLSFPLIATRETEMKPSATITACKLENGLFRGRILSGDAGLRCVPDDRASLRLVGVDFGDVNGDGVLDAVLLLIPISPEGGRRLLRVPVTRFCPDGPFEAPLAFDAAR